MMWYLQLVIDWTGMVLAQGMIVNLVFAALALGTAFRPTQRVCAVVSALVYLALALA